MSHLNKKLAATAAAAALLTAIGASFAQAPTDQTDPMATPQQVEVNGQGSGQQIYFFRDQGNSPETDPAAHLMLIKHDRMVPVAERTTTTTTTVAQSTTPMDSTVSTTMPAASDTSNTEASTDTAAAPDATPALAPKADRN
jgi:hypothetical protein